MARYAIAEFGVIQKNIANATVAIYETDVNGESTGVLATLYQEATGAQQVQNPQILDANGQLQNSVYIEDAVLAAITNINITTERAIKKIRVNPLQYPLPQTSAMVTSINSKEEADRAEAAADEATTQAGIATDGANTATTQAGIATAQAVIATDAAADATAQAAKLSGTSATSTTIATGTQVFTTQTDKDFNGNNVRVYSNADLNNFMDGLATYSGTTLSVDVTTIGGSGTFSDWVIKVNGHVGATGPAGNITDGNYTDITVGGSGTVMTINNGAVTTSKILDSNVTTAKILDSNVTTVKIADNNVTNSKMADNSVDTAEIINNSVSTSKLQDNAVTLDKMEHGTQGDIVTYDGTGAPVRLPIGTTGQVPVVNGAGTDLEYQDAPSGSRKVTPQTKTETLDIAFPDRVDAINISDGKILEVYQDAAAGAINLVVTTIDEDGTIANGAVVQIAGSSQSVEINVSGLTKLTDTKYLYTYSDNSSAPFPLKVALLTVDVVLNTITINDTQIIENGGNGDTKTYGEQMLRIDDETAITVYSSGTTNVYGRIITLATPTSLSVTAQQSIMVDAAFNGQYIQGFVYEEVSGHYIIIGYNADQDDMVFLSFSVTGTTISTYIKRVASTLNLATQLYINSMFVIARKGGFTYGFRNANGGDIPSEVIIETNEVAIFSHTYSPNSVSYAFGTNLPLDEEALESVRKTPKLSSGYIPHAVVDTLGEFVVITNKIDQASAKLSLYNKSTGEFSTLSIPNQNSNTDGRTGTAKAVKVRDNQMLIILSSLLGYEKIYLPIKMEGFV